MPLTTITLTNTFEDWRTRTNQLVTQSNYYEANLPNYVYANNIGVQANAFASVAIASNNITVGAGANAFASVAIASNNITVGAGANAFASVAIASNNITVGAGANAFASATIAGANAFASATIAGANAYMIAVQNGSNTAVGAGANAFASATIAGANTDVGAGANSYANVVWARANTYASNANNLTTGVVSAARIRGQYANITGVGTLTGGTWNANNIPLSRGGTNASLVANAGAMVYSTASGLAIMAVPFSGGYVAVSTGGNNPPEWQSLASSSVFTAQIAGSAGTFTSTTQDSQFNSIGVNTAASGTAGEIRATGTITANFSDRRLKTDIRLIDNALDKINQISGITFKPNEEAAKYGYINTNTQVGVISQEIEAVLPEVVVAAPFDIGKNEDGTEYSKSGENYKTVHYEKLIPLLIEAIKELSVQVKELKNK